jgi:epoxyqueuosine reductase
MVFGCDICQDVCPWNSHSRETGEEGFRARDGLEGAALAELSALTPSEFRRRFRRSAMGRAKREGLARNACIAMGNAGDRGAAPALARALSDEAAVVRGAAAWALGRLGERAPLEERLAVERDPVVRREIEQALYTPGARASNPRKDGGEP